MNPAPVSRFWKRRGLPLKAPFYLLSLVTRFGQDSVCKKIKKYELKQFTDKLTLSKNE